MERAWAACCSRRSGCCSSPDRASAERQRWLAPSWAVAVWWLAGAYFRSSPASLGQQPDGDTKLSADAALQSAVMPPAPLACGHAVWRDRRFATLSTAFALGLLAQIGLVALLFSLLAPALGDTGAGAAVSLATASAILGRSLFGMLLPADGDRRAVAALKIAGTMALLVAGGTSVPLSLLGCVLFGLGIGNLTSLPPLIAQAEFARADAGRVVALVTAVNQAVFAFAPVTLGALHDALGWAGAPIALAASVQTAALFMVLAARQHRRSPASQKS
jgi:predicted MFS family arabinose efflux permease